MISCGVRSGFGISPFQGLLIRLDFIPRAVICRPFRAEDATVVGGVLIRIDYTSASRLMAIGALKGQDATAQGAALGVRTAKSGKP